MDLSVANVEVHSALASFQASLQEMKSERDRDRAEYERHRAGFEIRLQTLELRVLHDMKQEHRHDIHVVQSFESGLESQEMSTMGERPEDKREEEHRCTREQLEYTLGANLWEATALIGLPQLGRGSSVLLALAMVLNAIVQLYLCFIMLYSDAFAGTRKFQAKLHGSKRWRFSEAHLLEHRDARGTSLAARVCGNDAYFSLASASSQATLLNEINTYMGLEPSELESVSIGTGPLLCCVCIFLFVVLVLRELRRTATSLLAAAAIPNGPTRVEQGTFVSMSSQRLLCFLCMGLVRVFVAILLLAAGVLWLSSTSSTTDLVLNAAALGFVMDLDELLQETMVSAKALVFVGSLQPVRWGGYRRQSEHLEAVLPLILTCVAVAACVMGLVVPNMRDMLEVKAALCGGRLDFVSQETPAGFVGSVLTVPFNSVDELTPSLTFEAVQELRDESNDDAALRYSTLMPQQLFELAVLRTVQEWGELSRCVDVDTVPLIGADAIIAGVVRQSTAIRSNFSLLQGPWTCEAYVGQCDVNALLRIFCPLTCGCADPLSGLFRLKPDWGCPVACQAKYSSAVASLNCTDQDVVHVPGWSRYWRQYGPLASAWRPESAALYQEFAEENIALGCANLQSHSWGVDLCDDESSLLSAWAMASVLPFCPQTCCSGANPPAACAAIC